MMKMEEKTREQLASDLSRILKYANQISELKQMCCKCENWCGDEHDYEECLQEPCFTFFRAFAYLDFSNTWQQ